MQKKIIKIQSSIGSKEELLQGFLNYKRMLGIKELTVKQGYWILSRFFRNYYQGEIKNCKELDKAIQSCLIGKSNALFNRYLVNLRQFFNYCVEEDALQYNPCEKKGFKYRKDNKRVINYSPDIIAKLLTMPDKTSFTGLRDYTLMLLMLDCGIRPGEALKLQLTDFKEKEIHVRAEIAKTKRERYLPLSPEVCFAIRKFISVRHPLWDNKNGILFCGFHGRGISSTALHKSFRAYAKIMGVDISPYHLRHTFALYFIRNGGDAFALQKLMGHVRLEQTLTYVNLVKGDVSEAHEKFSPLANFLNLGEKRLVNVNKSKSSKRNK